MRRRYDSAVGLLFMLGAVTCFTAMVTLVKLLREGGMSTLEVMTLRMGPGIPWVMLELKLRGQPFFPRRPGIVAMRSGFGSVAMGFYFWAVNALTLLQNTVLHLTQPVFVSVLAPVFLRERPRRAAVAALLIALAGAAVVVIPDAAFTTRGTIAAIALTIPLLPGLARLGSSIFSALAHMSIRMATAPSHRAPDTRPDAPETVVLYFMLTVTVLCGVAGLATGGFRALPTGYDGTQAALLIVGMAATGVAGQLLLSRAYSRSRAPAVAIVGYAAIPLSVLADAVVWGTSVEVSGYVGIGLMVGAGLLLTRAESAATERP